MTTPTEALDLVVGEGEFIQLRPALVRALGGEPDAAMVVTLVKWKINPEYVHTYERDGHLWWCASMPDLVERTGMTLSRVRRALSKAETFGMIYGEQHFLNGAWDKAKSYRLASPQDPRSLENIDLSPATDQANTDLSPVTDRSAAGDRSNGHGRQFEPSPATDLLLVKTQRPLHNTDSVGEDERTVDKSGPFRLTEGRQRRVTDALVAVGQAHHVPVLLSHLEMQSWGMAEYEIKRWCGVQEAARNGDGYRRGDIDELLGLAGIVPVTDAAWWAWLGEVGPIYLPDSQDCRFLEAGYCDKHGLRSEQHPGGHQ